MLRDADMFAGKGVVAEVAVVGSGPSGITCALELAENGFDVVLIESGTQKFSTEIQALGDADQVDLHRHAPMSECTRRQLGGASVIWGGRCVPYDPIDFDKRSFVADAEWPIRYADLLPYFGKACKYLVCGDPVFNSFQIPEINQKTIVPGLPDGDVKSSDLERWSLPTNFGSFYRAELQKSKRITVVQGLTCCRLVTRDDGKQVTSLYATSKNGRTVNVRARQYVLACGGLETTRLLLASNQQHAGGIGNQSDCLGRYYVGHISGKIARVHFTTPPDKTIYGYLQDRSGVYLRPRFTLSRECQLQNGLLNFAAWLVNPTIGNPVHGNGILSFAYLALASPFGKYFAPEAIRKAAIKDAPPGCTFRHAWNMFRDFPRTAAFVPSFGIRRFMRRRRVPGFFQPSRCNVYDLHYHAEQIPTRQSRVTLSTETDANGVPRLNIDFRYSQRDVDSVIRSHKLIDAHLRSHNVGHLEYATESLEKSVWEQAADGFHQVGTTRMSETPEQGVVDTNCRVHGVENLYLATGSIFPTSSQANTTFMIVVFALRLAAHLTKLAAHLTNANVESQPIGAK
jgi:choline dehydrogenase-like flavoprotein